MLAFWYAVLPKQETNAFLKLISFYDLDLIRSYGLKLLKLASKKDSEIQIPQERQIQVLKQKKKLKHSFQICLY